MCLTDLLKLQFYLFMLSMYVLTWIKNRSFKLNINVNKHKHKQSTKENKMKLQKVIEINKVMLQIKQWNMIIACKKNKIKTILLNIFFYKRQHLFSKLCNIPLNVRNLFILNYYDHLNTNIQKMSNSI
jgi:hypothetical protein